MMAVFTKERSPSYHLNIIKYANHSGNFYEKANNHLIFTTSECTGTMMIVTFPGVTAGSGNGSLVLTKIMNHV